MTRSYSDSDIRRLFTLTGDMCAFPNCLVKIVDGEIIVGEICHIEAKSSKGPRYNPNMTNKERRSFDNLIVFCPTHHTTVDKDPIKYTVHYLKELKISHERKHRDNQYKISDQVLKIVKVSVNYDEYSWERIHNLLKIFNNLEGKESKKEWFGYMKYTLKGLTIPSPIPDDKKEALLIVFNDINELKTNSAIFQELILIFLEKLPDGIRQSYIEKIIPYIEDMKENDFTNIHFPQFYNYLNKSEVESLEYLLERTDNLSKDQFENLSANIKISDLLKTMTKKQKIFMDFERRLWELLDNAEKNIETTKGKEEQERYNNLFQNIKFLVNKFMQTTS